MPRRGARYFMASRKGAWHPARNFMKPICPKTTKIVSHLTLCLAIASGGCSVSECADGNYSVRDLATLEVIQTGNYRVCYTNDHLAVDADSIPESCFEEARVFSETAPIEIRFCGQRSTESFVVTVANPEFSIIVVEVVRSGRELAEKAILRLVPERSTTPGFGVVDQCTSETLDILPSYLLEIDPGTDAQCAP